MRKLLALAVTAIFGLTLGITACENPTTSLEGPNSSAEPMTADASSSPANPGSSRVFRVEIPGTNFPAIMFVDGETDLGVLLSPTEGLRRPFTTSLCPGETQGEVNAVELQTIQQGAVESLLTAEVFAWAYDFPASEDGPGVVSCSFLTGDALLASGTANLRNVNNALGGAEDRASQFTFKVNGRLDLADGPGTTNLNETNTGVRRPDGTFVVGETSIRLNPDPRN